MRAARISIVMAAVLVTAVSCSRGVVYKDATAPVEKRVKDLIGRMTLAEKALQLSQYSLGENDNENNIGEAVLDIPAGIGSLIYFRDNPELRNEMQRKAVEESRLGIPVLFGYDDIHGFRTVYQISLGQACSWDPELIQKMASESASEARKSGVDWAFSPMIDVCRDPRWGRISEGYGEDPYTNGVFGAATLRGYQAAGLDSDSAVAACLKHYVGYGASEGGRDYVYTEISRQTLWDTYMPPYKACVEAGASTIMSAFNNQSGIPGSANHYTLTEVLRDKWGFEGLVVSDWHAVKQLINQGLAADLPEASERAFNAGIDMDMMSRCYDHYLEQLVRDGKISEKAVDEAVARVLTLKFRLGLFEHPYTADYPDRFLNESALSLASQIAAESMVLLKNEGDVLPLESAKRIAVIGPVATDRKALLGNWCAHGRLEDVHTLLSGVQEEFAGRAEVRYAKGCEMESLSAIDTHWGEKEIGDGGRRDVSSADRAGFSQAVSLARWSDVVVLCLGERGDWSGENCSRAGIRLPAVQEALFDEVAKTGKPVVLVLANGRPLDISRQEPRSAAILEVWQPGVNGAGAFGGILSGRINPSGKLAVTFPFDLGQIPIYYDRRPRARHTIQGVYKDITSEPLYEFGHGLSYTSFEYGPVTLSSESVTSKGTVTASIEVSNVGDRDGAEPVLWFISDPACSITRPIKELRHFERVSLKAGEKRTVTFEISPLRDLAFVDSDGNPLLEAGEFRVMAGPSAASFELK